MDPVRLLLVGACCLAALPWPVSAQAQRDERCFPETGFCIAGPIRAYWEAGGGLPVFGYPTTPQAVATVEGWSGPIQWFERDRLEDHGAEGVMAGRLGARLLELQGRPWQSLPPADGAPPGCAYIEATRQSLCEPFLSYWRANGGLERFGYPIGPVQEEQIGAWRGPVQYFERRRMEHHREHAGTPYEVLLGLLGNQVRALEDPQACAAEVLPELRPVYDELPFQREFGCPTGLLRETPATYQLFGQGEMISLDQPGAIQRIYVIFRYDWLHNAPRYTQYPYTWQPGEPEVQADPPEAHCHQIRRGIGKLWRERAEVRDMLGCATAEEQREPATVQTFSGGALVWLRGLSGVFVFGPDRQAYYRALP